MWSRKFLKDKAKVVLKISYFKAFVVSLVIAIVCGEVNNSFNFIYNFRNHKPFYGANMSWGFLFGGMVLKGIIIGSLFMLALRIFFGYALEVGGIRFFVQATKNDIDMNYLGYSFDKEKYLDIIKTMLWRSILNFLWYLLLIIPGIVKTYAYRMVPYILADNANIGCDRAIELSQQMTDDEKMDMFILDLSFIGWYLLGRLLFIVGVSLVRPYQNATNAELYLVLRENALNQGLCSYEELGLVPVENY